MRIIKRQTAQTALELAVFGAILIFMLGVIIKSSVNRNFQQHSILRATRWAMTQSNITTGTTNAARNFASVLVVEDRLSTASGKYGALERVPSIIQGAGMHSVNLLMPVDLPKNPAGYLDNANLRRMDVFVNGLHFDFTMEGFRRVELARKCAGLPGCVPTECDGNCGPDSPEVYPGADISNLMASYPLGTQWWEPNCADVTGTVTTQLSCVGSPCPDPSCTDCSSGSTETYPQVVTTLITVGCAKLYTISDNHKAFKDKNLWCDDGAQAGSKPCPPTCDSASPVLGCNLSAADRFDLDRDGVSDVDPADGQYFSWQWRLVMGFDEAWRSPDLFNETDPVITGTLKMAEGIILEDGWCEKYCQKAKNASFDADGDLKIEYMLQNTENNPNVKIVADGGVILSVGVKDGQLGDIDPSYDTSDRLAGKPIPGFTKDARMYSFVHNAGPNGGTYYQVEEGKLFGDSRQFIRNASKKDQIDYIERAFQLSNNTGRFCGAAGVRNPRADNPVDVCGVNPGDCFASTNIEKVCMDTVNKVIFIRNRIEDLHGRKWVTDVSGDPNINFTVPVPLNTIFHTRSSGNMGK
jgi:hypothetical protein